MIRLNVTDWIIAHEGTLRIAVFLGLLIVFCALEALFPRKNRVQKRLSRWATNLLIVVIDTVILRAVFTFIFAAMAVGMAALMAQKGWGLFNLLALPLWLEIIIAMILLDGFIYAQHVASHLWKPLWAFHKVHHADRDIDATTALRFHPVEIVLSMFYKMVVIILLGPAVTAVILFEILLNGSAMFNHMNLKMPYVLDRVIRQIFVTPDMHRVHHSIHPNETHSNFGFCLSMWDRLFGTYIDQPRDGHDDMVIGLPDYQDHNSAPHHLIWAMLIPFKKEMGKK